MALNWSKFPWLTAGVALGATALFTLAAVDHSNASSATRSASATWAEWATFQRTAYDGNVVDWLTVRAWTTHVVHVSSLHLLGSGFVWLIAAASIERISRASLALMLIFGAPLITWAAMLAEPAMGSYVGLSGLACGCVAWLAFERICDVETGKRAQLAGVVLALLVIARIAVDLLGNGTGWGVALHDSAGLAEATRVSRYGHLAGAVIGALCWLGYTLLREFRNTSTTTCIARETKSAS